MDFQKCKSSSEAPSLSMVPLSFSNKLHERPQCQERNTDHVVADVDIDLREVYFLIMHFLSAGPCQKTFGQFWNELLEHELLPRRYHAWYSRSGACSGDENDNGFSFPLGYNNLVERYPHIGKDHLVKLLKQLMLNTAPPLHGEVGGNAPSAVDVPTLLGTGSFSLLDCHKKKENKQVKPPPDYLRWPHMQADQVRGLSLREIGGGFTKHHRAPSIRSACYAIAKPSTMVQRMQNMKKLRGHRDAVYCAIFDRSGRYVITGSDDRLVKIWSMETAFCLASCRGHEGDITDLAVSSNNVLVASASNDFIIRVWRLPDGLPISVLRGHTGAVTAIAFSPRPSSVYQLLSSSDDGSCRIWDARFSQCSPRIYLPKPPDAVAGKNSVPSMNGTSSSNGPQSHQILCCAFNASGTVFVTGSSDTFARVWSACKSSTDDSEQPNHEIDVLSGHENDVNYVQFSACAGASRSSVSDTFKEESLPKFKNSWFCHDNIVTCSRDGSAIIWIPRSRRYHGKVGRWTRAYHLKVPPPPMPPQPPRGGPRQRLLPTPRGVNMIVWSLDNRFVLAAIMDCRICVWNAADGSLVHSLTGHSASTYVLDVHPFNPRIAMSAGYDGKTIVWDIWEGIPIRTYEIGRFKLVDGKFSPDGTSIVLSDDVGQIYLLNTGQGESQKDAKYDQFFLGDYRPLIRDTIGNVLDQETQLAPHRRNIQDPLCDSSMIPYSEPYQTMYQQRRLGALGIEWHPSSINLAVGPDFSLGQEYQMPPLADLDRVMEPLPELVDAVYWEPENEVISDDTDSEYNIAEEYSSEGEHGSLSAASSFSDPECSAEDTDVEHSHKDGLRRSRRKKYRSEVEIMTSSGRRVKRRNLNECDGTSSRSRTKKSKNGRKVSKRNSSKIQSLRPQRAAKRNALNMFSQITETSTEGDDEEGLEDDSSGSEQSSLNEFENAIKFPESQSNAGNRRRLVLKFSLRDSKKSIPSEDTRPKCNTQADIVHSPSRPPPKTVEEKETNLISEDPESSSMHAADLEQSQNHNRDDFIHKPRSEETEDHLDTSAGYKDNKIRWGENKDDVKNNELAPPGEANKSSSFQGLSLLDDHQKIDASAISSNGNLNKQHKDKQNYDAVHKRAKSYMARTNAEGYGGSMEESASNAGNYNYDSGIDFHEATTDAVHRTRSMVRDTTSQEPNNVMSRFKVREETSKNAENYSKKTRDQLQSEEWMSSSRMRVRSRSTRYRRGDYDNYLSPSAGRISNFSGRKVSWLMLSEHEEGYRYIPQQGDEVVYLRQGHQEYIEKLNLRSEVGPWRSPKTNIRAVEICSVEDLVYASLAGSGDSCCKITLKFTDPLSSVFGRTFKLTLPELINFSDFVVEKTRYDAAIGRNWTHRDKCLVWWRNGEDGGGSWWEGRILAVEAKSREFPDSPWERYVVKYKGDAENNLHSPWELHDPDIQWEQPQIDFEIRDKLLSSFAKLESAHKIQDYYGIQKFNQVAQKLDFLNRFPVPLYPELIQARLENNYYRTLEAVKHDIMVMLSNAQSYFGRNAELSSKMKRLSDWFTRTLSKL
ncbi:unnamed protein product, partial [Vitis vinifera]